MSDDIDIEEHDILDNPHIRNIFPDLSVVKKEISEYFNEVLPVKQEPELSESESPGLGLGNKASKSDEFHKTFEDKNVQEHSNIPTDNVKKQETNISFQKNKIIIGSKPNKVTLKNGSDTRTKNQIRFPKVFLHDIRTNLEKSERYCKKCRILFAEKSKLTDHVKNHSTTLKRQVLTRTFMPHIRLKKSDENNVKSVTDSDTSKNMPGKSDKPLTRLGTSNKLDKNIKPFTRLSSSKTKTNEHVKHSASSDTSSSQEDEDVEMPLELNSLDSSEDETVVESLTKQIVPRCRICGIRVANRGNLVRHYRNIHRKKLTFISTRTNDKVQRNSRIILSAKTKTSENAEHSTSSGTFSSEDNKNVVMPPKLNSLNSLEDEIIVESLTKLDVPRCRICDIRVANRGNLVRHYRTIHRKKLTFTSTKTIDTFRRNSSNKLSPIAKFDNDLKVKYINKTKDARDSSNRCKTCNMNFSSFHSLHRHLNRNIHKTITKSSPFKCNIDQREKNREINTKNTRTTITDTENKKCFHCDKEFPDSKSLIEHVYQILKPKRTKNSDSVINELEQAECNTVNKKSLEQKNVPCIKNLRPTKIKTNDVTINSNKKHLEARKKTINKRKVRPTKNKSNKIAIKNYKKRFETRYETTNKKYLRSTKSKVNNDAMKSNAKEKNLLYVCQHCTYCFVSIKNYIKHMMNRHGTKVSKINRQPFDPQCKYCSSRNSSALYHNRHLYKEHLVILDKKITSENRKVPESDESVIDEMQNSKAFAFKSAVFKCGRCDIHFISSETAKDHSGHMEFLINCKCSICDLIFKKRDERMHLLQHLYSEYITVHEFSSEALSNLLYNCTKCTIHFSEKKYLDHYEKCEKETAISTYCKACDILINEADAIIHISNHKQNEEFSSNVITSDIIFDNKSNSVNKSSTTNTKKNKKTIVECGKKAVYPDSMYTTFTYCPTCQCFMTLVKNIHLKKQCRRLIKRICVNCGILLTGKSIDTHRKYYKMKDLVCSMQDYTFSDLSGNIIKPPIPEFPQCKICNVYFVNKLGIIGHVCSEFKDITSCDICDIKLSNTAFKLHMAYHNYCFKNEKLITHTNNKTPSSQKNTNVESKNVQNTAKATTANHNKTSSSEKNLNVDRKDAQTAAKNTTATDNKPKSSERNVVSNYKTSTQDIYETQNSSIIQIEPNIAILFSCKSCFITLITYDKLIEHCQNHPTAEEDHSLNLRSCNICNLKFDFLTYEKHLEIHTKKLTLKNLTVDVKQFVFDKKIWLNHVFQTLNPIQINEIIGKSIYQNEHRVKFKIFQSGPHNLTIYKCARCSLFFDHENVYRHAKCKNLNIRGTPCASCGLKFLSGALRNQHLKIHFVHPNINEKSYRIILFNQVSDEEHSNIVAQPSQYIIYQCRNCNGVIEKSDKHQCIVSDLKKCYNCGLVIYKGKFKNHLLEHKNSTNFKPENMKVILLGAKNENMDTEISVPYPSFKGLIYDYTLYQCKRCETCVKNDVYISNHVCVFGIYRCQCQKCGFFFNSRGYNHHLKTHSVDPDFKTENINIVQFDSNSNTDVKEKETNDKDKNKELEHKVKIESANKVTVVLYKCKCGLHFVDRCNVIKHIKQCNPKINTNKQNCTKCSLLFNPNELFSHLVNHHGNKNTPIKFDVKEICEENMEELKNIIIFNCSKCGLHYLDKTVASDHYKLCKGDIGDFEECTKCKLLYDKSSFVLDEHNENCENNFEIEIIDESNIEVTTNVDLAQ